MSNDQLVILLVEDNDDHAELIKRGLIANNVICKIFRVTDGKQALDYVFRQGDYQDPKRSPKPSLVLLDLRMPKVDGIQVLKKIKTDHENKFIPVVVLTSSDAELDISRAYKYNANSFLVKPIDYNKFDILMEKLSFYWLSLNKKP